MLLKLQWLTDIFDWLHHNWERTHVQRKVALVIFWIYVAALCCVELKRQGMLPPALAQLTPHSHFSAIQLAFTLILGLEVMSLIFIISTSFSRSVGKQFEILALILLRNAFKELAHLPEPVSIAGNLDPVIHIAVTALGPWASSWPWASTGSWPPAMPTSRARRCACVSSSAKSCFR